MASATTVNPRFTKQLSLRFSLLVLAVACILPAAFINGLLLQSNFELRQLQAQQSTLLLARQVSAELDNELSRIETALKVLATAPELLNDDLASFHVRARNALEAGTVNNYILTDRRGHQIINTLVPFGKPLPTTGTPKQLERVFTQGHTVLTDIFYGPVVKRHVIAMGVPVIREGEVIYSLNIGLSPDRINALMKRQQLPLGWLVGVMDSSGNITGRSLDPDRFVGQPVVPALMATLKGEPENHLRTSTKEGINTYVSYKRMEGWDWTVVVGVDEDTLNKSFQPLIWQVVGLTAMALGGGLLLAWLLARQVLSTMRGLNAAAQGLISGGQVAIPQVQFREAEAVGEALQEAALAMRQITYEAQHDPLTQLANRAMFTEMADRQLALCRRNQQALAVLAIDLDHFKEVNDTQGHAVGDAVLIEAAQRILGTVRTSDTAARIGGDEYLVLLNSTDPVHALATAKRIVEALAKPYPMTPCPVSASAGVALFPDHGENLVTLTAAADRALYAAKSAGRGRALMADEAPAPPTC